MREDILQQNAGASLQYVANAGTKAPQLFLYEVLGPHSAVTFSMDLKGTEDVRSRLCIGPLIRYLSAAGQYEHGIL